MQDTSVPSLDDLAGEWLEIADLAHLPSLHNFHRMAVCARDLLGVHYWTGPQDMFLDEDEDEDEDEEATLEYRSYPRLALSLDGVEPAALSCRWYAYQALRRGVLDGLELTTAVRMLFEESGLLVRMTLRNPGSVSRDIEVTVSGLGRPAGGRPTAWVSTFEGVGHLATVMIEVPDATESDTASWRLRLDPGEERVLRLAQTEGPERDAVVERAHSLVAGCDAAWDATRHRWEHRWEQTFAPGNAHFSGHMPVLDTNDGALAHVYYAAVLTMFVLHRTNLALSDRVFVTSGERAHGTVFFWDLSMCARLLALWEPVAMREQLRFFLTLDPFGGALVNLDTGEYLGTESHERDPGHWYAANHMALFRLVHEYVAVTGDLDFLDEHVGDRTVLEHMESLATAWRSLVSDPGLPLADYGDVDNLLECVPTYAGRVASLNAANVWMLRTVAALLRRRGEEDRAAALLADAERVADAVLSLYERGEGVWSCIDDSGHRIAVRHCYDFICTSEYLADRLSEQVRTEMVGFVERELLTTSWMRAQSLADPAAAESDRPDHGPYGAFGAWPALTAEAMFDLGHYAGGVSLLRRVDRVLAEGVFGQAYELWGPDRDAPDAPVRIASRGFCLREGSAGGAFAEVVIAHVFGFHPTIGVRDPRWRSDEGRPVAATLGRLHWSGRTWTLRSLPSGIEWTAEDGSGVSISRPDVPTR